MSGQLLHQLLCRQLHTQHLEETWFIFGGYPIRFSLAEFATVTGLNCSPYPSDDVLRKATVHSHGNSPYWYELIGGTLGATTVSEIVAWLKADPTIPPWRKFRLALIILVEGILLCRTQPVKPSVEVVEMVRNVHFFLNYPWGRHAFSRTLRMIKVGNHITSTASLVTKLNQFSLAVHGFPLAI